MSFFKRIFSSDKKQTLDEGLARSKRGVLEKLTRAVTGKQDIDADVLEELEEALITSDIGVQTTTEIVERIEDRTSRGRRLHRPSAAHAPRGNRRHARSPTRRSTRQTWTCRRPKAPMFS